MYHGSLLLLTGTDILEGDPLGNLSITPQVPVYFVFFNNALRLDFSISSSAFDKLPASFPGILRVENRKRDCTSHQGVSCNGPW